jgi:hypothetical protein
MRGLRKREKSIRITGIPAKTPIEHLHNTILDCCFYASLLSLMTYLTGLLVRQVLPSRASQTKVIFTAKISTAFLLKPVCSIFFYCLKILHARRVKGTHACTTSTARKVAFIYLKRRKELWESEVTAPRIRNVVTGFRGVVNLAVLVTETVEVEITESYHNLNGTNYDLKPKLSITRYLLNDKITLRYVPWHTLLNITDSSRELLKYLCKSMCEGEDRSQICQLV